MKVGYARVSTVDQCLDMQLQALAAAGCERIYEDTGSGSSADRPGLVMALEVLRPGDVLVIWKLDRLGRSFRHLVGLVGDLAAREVQIRSVTDGIDTTTPAGQFFFRVMASLAEMELELNHERTRAGLAAAREQGRTGGRKRVMTESKVVAAERLLAGGTSPRTVAADLGVSLPTLYRWLPAASR
jgi:DNA invertase Pin-like site-specific DNA recombinase